MLSTGVLFAVSHQTCYKYNDWYVLGNDINKVVKRHGNFDTGSIKIDKSGSIGYYIYKGIGPVMPDNLSYYCYDDNGIVYKVGDMAAKGG